jgi:hypothetical protein
MDKIILILAIAMVVPFHSKKSLVGMCVFYWCQSV